MKGWCITPATGWPSTTSPSSVPHVGIPLMNARVPSIGSMIQLIGPAPVVPLSSPITWWSGKRAVRAARTWVSTPLSASVTGSYAMPASLLSTVMSVRK